MLTPKFNRLGRASKMLGIVPDRRLKLRIMLLMSLPRLVRGAYISPRILFLGKCRACSFKAPISVGIVPVRLLLTATASFGRSFNRIEECESNDGVEFKV